MADDKSNGSEGTKRKTCFVVTPIGSATSPERKHADQVLKHIIRPTLVEELDFEEPVRADHMPEPGIITRQIIQHLLTDDLVIADLTGSNPNVFYELAIRHAVAKPFVQITAGGSLPFDVAPQKTIFFDRTDWDNIEATRKVLKDQVVAALATTKVETPIGQAILFLNYDKGDPAQQMMAQIMDRLDAMNRNAFSPVDLPSSNVRRMVDEEVYEYLRLIPDADGAMLHDLSTQAYKLARRQYAQHGSIDSEIVRGIVASAAKAAFRQANLPGVAAPQTGSASVATGVIGPFVGTGSQGPQGTQY